MATVVSGAGLKAERLLGLYRQIEPTEAEVGRSLAMLVPVGPHTFRLEGVRPNGPHCERVVFELDGQGKVARMRIGAGFCDQQREESISGLVGISGSKNASRASSP
jgi:hypothetical protein